MPHADHYLLAGVMGFPIMHSRSPVIHNHWLAQHVIAGHYAPLLITPKMRETATEATLDAAFRAGQIARKIVKRD